MNKNESTGVDAVERTGESAVESIADRSDESAHSILIVDDDVVFRERLGRAFERRGYCARLAANGDEAIEMASGESPEYAVVDMRMPGPSGLEVVKELTKIDPTTRVVVLTGYGNIATAVEAIKLGAVNYLPKPADADDVIAAFSRAEGDTEEASVAPGTTRTPSLARAEWEHIHRVLQDCEGNISEAARRLGIHRRSLQRKLHKHAP